MLYGCLEICANCLSPKQCNKCCTIALGNVPKLPKNSTTPFPRNLCQTNSRTDRIDCTESVQYGLYFLPRFSCPFFPDVQNSKIRTERPFLLDCTFPRFLCLLFLLYSLLNPYSTTCLQCCPCYLDFCASLQPWNACPSSAEMASSPNSKNALSLALSK
jgi:hypothetical protein